MDMTRNKFTVGTTLLAIVVSSAILFVALMLVELLSLTPLTALAIGFFCGSVLAVILIEWRLASQRKKRLASNRN